ncbi:hypothetical protein ACFY9F_36100 [Streptomyces sp. NPDC012421]|uniref:hypothetical protein n=1 Tax=Streptomyces sp. NPDC012421 TaxID=3364832 RepID=UPI0036E0C439
MTALPAIRVAPSAQESTLTYPPEFTDDCAHCGLSVDGPDVACDSRLATACQGWTRAQALAVSDTILRYDLAALPTKE